MTKFSIRRVNEPVSSSDAEPPKGKKSVFRKLKTKAKARVSRKVDKAVATLHRISAKFDKSQAAGPVGSIEPELPVHHHDIPIPDSRAAVELQRDLESDGVEALPASIAQVECSTEAVMTPMMRPAEPEKQVGPRPDWQDAEPEDWKTPAPSGKATDPWLQTTLESILGTVDMPHECLTLAAPRWPTGNRLNGDSKLIVAEILQDDGIVKGRDPGVYMGDVNDPYCSCPGCNPDLLPPVRHAFLRGPTPYPRIELCSLDFSSIGTSWMGAKSSCSTVEVKPIPQQALRNQWREHRQAELACSSSSSEEDESSEDETSSEDESFSESSVERLIRVQAYWNSWRKRAAALMPRNPESFANTSENSLSTTVVGADNQEGEPHQFDQCTASVECGEANEAPAQNGSGYISSSGTSTPFDCRSFRDIETFLDGLYKGSLMPSLNNAPPESPKLRYTLKGLVDDSLPQPTPSPEPDYRDKRKPMDFLYGPSFLDDSDNEDSDDDAYPIVSQVEGNKQKNAPNLFADSAAATAGEPAEPFKNSSSLAPVSRVPVARRPGPAVQALLRVYEGDMPNTANTEDEAVPEDPFSNFSGITTAGHTEQLRLPVQCPFSRIAIRSRPAQRVSLLSGAFSLVSRDSAGSASPAVALPNYFSTAGLSSPFDGDSDDGGHGDEEFEMLSVGSLASTGRLLISDPYEFCRHLPTSSSR